MAQPRPPGASLKASREVANHHFTRLLLLFDLYRAEYYLSAIDVSGVN
jgi:hypothetical protein